MRFLLDTNICIYIIRGKRPDVLQRLTAYSINDIGISAISVAELQFGVHKSAQPAQNQQALDQFLVPLTTLDFDYTAAVIYGQVRSYLEAQGTPIGSLDTLIAAHALSQNLTLVTNNTKEFSRVPNLMVEDWSAS
jgi:tRNA(fMet)-specific endonuclease VapC